MIKLLNANFHELFRSKCFILTVLICTVIGAGLTAGMYFYPNFNMPESSGIVVNKDNVLGIMPSFAAIVIPFAASATVAVMLDSQYKQGTVRNMMTCGHTRTEIFFADLITMSTATVIYFVCYQAGVFSLSVFVLGYEGYTLKAALVSMTVMLLMLICISTVLSLVLGNLMRDRKTTVIILAAQYALNMSIVFGMFKNNSKVLGYVSKVFPQSNIFDLSYSVIPDKIEENIIITLTLMTVLTIAGIVHFKKCDLK